MSNEKEVEVARAGRGAFHTEGSARTKALRPGESSAVQDREGRPVWPEARQRPKRSSSCGCKSRERSSKQSLGQHKGLRFYYKGKTIRIITLSWTVLNRGERSYD